LLSETGGFNESKGKQGSIVLDKRSKTWNFFYWQDRKRHSKAIGTLKNLPTKAAAWRAAKALREAVEQQATLETRSLARISHRWVGAEGFHATAGLSRGFFERSGKS
jgi:hypothetical protein